LADQESTTTDEIPTGAPGGFVVLAIVAAAVGAVAALLLGPERRVRSRRGRSRLDGRIAAAAGLMVGAGLAALLTPESGPTTRRRLSGTLSRIKVGAIDRIERLRLAEESREADRPG
jgi:hypothetical protein